MLGTIGRAALGRKSSSVSQSSVLRAYSKIWRLTPKHFNAMKSRSLVAAALILSVIHLNPQLACAQDTAQPGSVDSESLSGIVPSGIGVDGSTLNFQADLFTGRFTYSVPIMVAPGRQGAQPKLALGYSCRREWLMWRRLEVGCRLYSAGRAQGRSDCVGNHKPVTPI